VSVRRLEGSGIEEVAEDVRGKSGTNPTGHPDNLTYTILVSSKGSKVFWGKGMPKEGGGGLRSKRSSLKGRARDIPHIRKCV